MTTMARFLVVMALLSFYPGVHCQLEFIDAPASATVLANFPTTLSCSLQPGPSSTSLSVGWEKGGLPLVADNQRVFTTFDSSTRRSELRISSVSYRDAGVYLCRATDEAASMELTSNLATITVQGIPVFDTPLAPVTVLLGTVAELQCQVVSNPPATITWSYELGTVRRNLTTGGRVIISPSNTLTILNVAEADAGYYVCTAQNVFGRNMTSGRLLIGTPVTPFEVSITPSEPDPLMLIEGDSVTLRCTVPPTTTISSISWTRLGMALSSVTQISGGLLLSLTSVGKEVAGQYTCSVMDTAGTNVSRSIEITVLSPPVFVEEPADVTGVVGQSLQGSLVCTVEGEPTPIITWLDPDLSPLMVDQGTGAPSFPTLSTDDEGTYTCVAANSVGEIRSQFTITVQAPPEVNTMMSSVTTPPGRDVILQCTASGSPAASISWSKPGGALPTSSIFTGNSLYLYSVSSSDAGTYLCTATNSIGSDSIPIQLTVLVNPRITSSTASPVVLSAGSSLVLSCASSGPPETTLAWYHNATLLQPSSEEGVRVAPDGTLTVSDTDISDTGTYTCNVSTSFTFVLSDVQVVVGVAPTIVTPPTDTDLPPGARALLRCQAGGFPSPHATWFRTDIVSGERVELNIVGPSHTQLSAGLELHDVTGSDTGTYECMEENALGSDTQQATVRVEGPPVATSILPTVFSADTTVTLNCSTVLNFPQGVVTWHYSTGASLPAERFTVDEEGVLTASPILLEDAGSRVMCRVTNQYGQSSVTATIQILFRPMVTVATPPEDILVGSMAVLSCSARGDPLPVIAWRLPDGSDPQDSGNVVVNAASGNLTVFSAGGHNSGTYTCTASNSLGSTSASGQLLIRGEPVGDLTGIVGTTSIRVEWTDVPGQSGVELQSFDIRVTRQGRTEPVVQSSLSFFTRIFMNAELAPGLTYEVRLTGVFSEGITGLPRVIFLTTLEDVPSGPPLNLEVSPLENGIQLEWKLPHEDERNGVIISYNVEYRQTPAADNPEAPYQVVSVTSIPGGENDTTNHTLLDLNGGSSYDVRVLAFTAIGPGPPSDIVTVTTIRVPLPPTVGIGVGVAVGCVVLIVAVVVGVALLCLLHRRRTRAGKHEPMAAEERGRKRDEKDRKKKIISGPVAGITPKIDQGKFKVQGEHGNSIDLKPKVITAKDMAPPPGRGDSVKKVPRTETVLAASNDESDQGRIDPYSTPSDAVKRSGQVRTRQQVSSSPRVQVEGTVPAGVYSEVSEVMRTPPSRRSGEEEEEEEMEEDKPYEEMEIGGADTWLEESEGRSLGSRTASPEHPEAPDEGIDTSNLLYASVPQAHIDKKREKRQQIEQQLTKEEEKRREKELKQQKKMQEKMERERLKMEEKERKRREKEKEQERKRREALMKERAKEAKRRESLGLSNFSYQDIDFTKPGARAQAKFIDAATAAMF